MNRIPALPFPRRPALGRPEMVVVDVEGNGRQPPEIVEIAILALTSGVDATPHDLRSWLVRPTQPISGLVTRKVHGISNDDVADAPHWSTLAPRIAALLGDGVLVAHNATVERRVLTDHLPGWRPRLVLDTMRAAKAVWPGLPGGYGLDSLIAHADLASPDPTGPTNLPGPTNPPGGRPLGRGGGGAGSRRHRAGYDAWMTAALLAQLVTELTGQTEPDGGPADPVAAWERLVAVAQLPDPTPRQTGGDPEGGLW